MNIVEETLAMYWNQHSGLPYKEVLEYIQTDGTQYWDTGHVRANTGEVEIDFMVLPTDNFPRVYGDRTDTSRQFAIGRSSYDGHILTYWDKRSDVPPAGYGFDPLNNRVFVRFGHGYVYEKSGSEEYTYQLPSATFTSSGTAKIGGYMYNDSISGMIGRIYVCREYNGTGELTHDYIPVLDYNGDACLYDRVTGRMLYHKNTTGSTKPTYKRWDKIDLEYLECTGTQYIDTGVNMSGDLTLQCRAQNKYRSSSIIRGSTLVNGTRYNIFILTGSSSYATMVQASYNISGSSDNLQINNIAVNSWFDAKLTNKTLIVNGVSTSTASTSFPDTSGHLYLSALVVDDVVTPSSSIVANIKIQKANVLIRDFIPTRDRNGVNCMYDACYNKMYYNAGTGEFKGKVKLPDGYEAVEYLESTGEQWIDTGYVIVGDDYGIDIDFKFTSYQAGSLFGFQLSEQLFVIRYNGASGAIYCQGRNSRPLEPNRTYTGAFSVNLRTFLSVRCVGNNVYFSRDNGAITQYGNVVTSQANGALSYYLFDNHYTDRQTSMARLFSCVLTQNQSSVRNFIPCIRKSDGKPGLYDLCHSICPLTGTSFYVNAGTGEFIVPSQS